MKFAKLFKPTTARNMMASLDNRMSDSLAMLAHDRRLLEQLADIARNKLGNYALASSARHAAGRFEFLYNYFTQLDGLEKDLDEIEKAADSRQALADKTEKFGMDSNFNYILKNILVNPPGDPMPKITIAATQIKIEDVEKFYGAEDYRGRFFHGVKISGIRPEMMLRGMAHLHAYDLLIKINAVVPEDSALGELNKLFASHAAGYIRIAMPVADEKENK